MYRNNIHVSFQPDSQLANKLTTLNVRFVEDVASPTLSGANSI